MLLSRVFDIHIHTHNFTHQDYSNKCILVLSIGATTVDLCPQCGGTSHGEVPCFFLKYRELAKVKPNSECIEDHKHIQNILKFKR